MTTTLIIDQNELMLIMRALTKYQDTICWEDDLDNEHQRIERIKEYIKHISKKQRKGSVEL